jgi:predicted component of type VI protein secretion system
VIDETAVYVRVRGDVVRVAGRSAVVGRSRNCDVQIDEQGVSRRHCEVLLTEEGVTVRDLGSSHGTWINSRRVSGQERLGDGVLVSLGTRGPHFEVINAIVHGRPVLGAAPDSVWPATGAPGAPVSGPQRTQTVMPPPAAVAAPSPAPVAAEPGLLASPRFRRGLLWGALAGLLAGVAISALIPLSR